jgi:hypothetical protein
MKNTFLLIIVLFFFNLIHFSQSQLTTTWCGATVSNLGVNVYCTGVTGAIGYKFEVREVDETYIGEYNAYTNNTANKFRFTWMPAGTIQYSTTYHLRVSWFNGTVWSNWGPMCELSTPDQPLTQLTTAWCGNQNVLTSGTNIFCTGISGTVQYQFTISAPGYGFITNLVKTTNSFKLSELPSPHPLPGLQYNVEVRTRQTLNEPFGDPGNICFVKLAVPTTVISSNDCGRTINYLQQDTLHALPLSSAQGYRWRIVSDGISIIDTVANLSTYNGITLRKFPGIQYCKSYSISVQVLMNGTWGNWGSACNISTTCSPTTELRPLFQTNPTISSCGTNIYFNSILFASLYEYSIVGGTINEIYQSISSGFKLQQLASASQITYNTTYQIKCRVLLNNVWQPWGPTGNITLNTTSKLNGYCNQTIPTTGTNIYAIGVGCVQDYRFRINGPGVNNYIHNPSTMTNCFRLNQISGIQFNQTYTVEVSFLAAGIWSDWGPSCTIQTPMAIIPNPIIYPSPFTNTFKIDSVQITKPVLITDLSGKVMETIVDPIGELGGSLPTGVYYIVIEDKVYKIFKN